MPLINVPKLTSPGERCGVAKKMNIITSGIVVTSKITDQIKSQQFSPFFLAASPPFPSLPPPSASSDDSHWRSRNSKVFLWIHFSLRKMRVVALLGCPFYPLGSSSVLYPACRDMVLLASLSIPILLVSSPPLPPPPIHCYQITPLYIY